MDLHAQQVRARGRGWAEKGGAGSSLVVGEDRAPLFFMSKPGETRKTAGRAREGGG